MSVGKTASLLVIVGLMACGQILFKIAAGRLGGGADLAPSSLIRAALDPFLLTGIALYGLTTLLWVVVLRDTALSKAYPFVALTLVLVPLTGIIVFDEPFSLPLLLGGLLILAGVLVISAAP